MAQMTASRAPHAATPACEARTRTLTLLPAPGTDCARLLNALIAAHPEPVWSPNSRLGITAHSRAAELRKLGWDIVSVSRPAPGPVTGRQRRQFGYKLGPRHVEDAA